MNGQQARSTVPDIINRLVNFQLRDVHMPDPRDVSLELHAHDILQGRVLDLTDSGATRDAFVVVEIDGVAGPVIVPMERIIGVI
jgi:hypothetical protein